MTPTCMAAALSALVHLQKVLSVKCMIKIFRGGGMVDGEGGSSEGCLKWGGGGSLRDLSKSILKQGRWVKAKVVRRGEGVLKVSPPLPPPPENFNHTPIQFSIKRLVDARKS